MNIDVDPSFSMFEVTIIERSNKRFILSSTRSKTGYVSLEKKQALDLHEVLSVDQNIEV